MGAGATILVSINTFQYNLDKRALLYTHAHTHSIIKNTSQNRLYCMLPYVYVLVSL